MKSRMQKNRVTAPRHLGADPQDTLPDPARRHHLALGGAALLGASLPGGGLWAGTDATALAAAAPGQPAAGARMIVAHGYSFFGDLKYGPDLAHFDYVNPDAPKGGEIRVAAQGSFDSLNPYTRHGNNGAFSWAIYESLMISSESFGSGSVPADTLGESYGLLAHTVEYPATKDWVIFHMRPEARFSDGTPVTAHDVVFTHNLFIEQGLPSFAMGVGARVLGAEALDDHTVRFTFAPDISRRSLIDQVGSTPVFPRAWFERTGARLDESRTEIPPGSGPYVLDRFEIPRNIVYRRNPDYWGGHLPLNRGRHNFDTIRVEYFADGAAAFQNFQTAEYTFRQENNSRQWATGYDFPAVQRGHVVRKEIPVGTPPTPSGFVFNLERAIFADRRVREAVSLAYNFEWTNATLQHGLFQQRHSFSERLHQAHGLPSDAERALLERLGDLVPAEVLSEPAVMAHSSNAERLLDRGNLRRAMALLAEAGWTVGTDGALRNGANERMRITIPVNAAGSATAEAIIETFTQNLQSMGIDARAQRIDAPQFTLRRRNRDYDMILDGYIALIDVGTGLKQRFGSEAADDVFNPAGLRSPLVDAVIEEALMAQGPDERDTALTVLDRVLRWERFMIPTWFSPVAWVAHWDMFGHPEQFPPYAIGDMDFWWFDQERFAALRAAGAIR